MMKPKVRHRLDIGRDRLRKLVNNAKEATPRLPLVHTTDSFALEDILSSENIKPQSCSVFNGEALTYFFYGRPAFRPNSDAEPTGLYHYFPVCLIFKLNFSASIARMFPFDSGAYANDFYAAYIHNKMRLGDFGLEADASTPGRVISQFFGSVPAYLQGRPVKAPTIDPAEFEAHSYLALIHAKHGNAIDSRGTGIEVQTSDDISLSKTVAAIVLPSSFADGATGTKLKALGIDLLPYKTFERSRPSEYTSAISTLCMNYYLHLKLISGTDF